MAAPRANTKSQLEVCGAAMATPAPWGVKGHTDQPRNLNQRVNKNFKKYLVKTPSKIVFSRMCSVLITVNLDPVHTRTFLSI